MITQLTQLRSGTAKDSDQMSLTPKPEALTTMPYCLHCPLQTLEDGKVRGALQHTQAF